MQTALPSAAQPAVITVDLLYFAVIVGISVWAARRTRTASDFFVAGKGIGLVALTVASVSVSVSGFAFIGGPALFSTAGNPPLRTERARAAARGPGGGGADE